MIWTIAKLAIASSVIAFSSWLAGKRPVLAGFVLALPISTLLALAFNQAEFRDWEKSVAFAKSIFLAIPLSLLFFLPFLLAERLRWPFWGLYAGGLGLLVLGYGIHRAIAE